MSFNEDAVLAKFSTLTETQESIVSISQWVRRVFFCLSTPLTPP